MPKLERKRVESRGCGLALLVVCIEPMQTLNTLHCKKRFADFPSTDS
jgi:hypothetical protein